MSAWQVGETAVVLEVPGSSPLAARLRELGVVPGALIRVLRATCPLVIQVGGGRFCLRKRDASCIRVGQPFQELPAEAAG